MIQVKKFLSKWGIHSFLLPVFFTLHNYLQYYGLVSAGVALKVLGEFTVAVVLFLLLTLALTKKLAHSLQITTLVFFPLLFYGVIKDFFSKTLQIPMLARYTLLFPFIALAVILVCILIRKKKSFLKTNFFQNILLLVFILVDMIPLIYLQSSFFLNRNLLVTKKILDISKMPVPAEKPDVYFLLFDCYPGTGFLSDYMKFDNKAIESELKQKGFRVILDPKSNYNRTAFSMVSEFNFEYLKGINNNTRLRSNHYNRALYTMRSAAVPAVFDHLGYKIYNLSIFEFAGLQPLYNENFLTLPERDVLLFNTFTGRFKNDILWNFSSGRFSNSFFRYLIGDYRESQILLELAKRDFTNRIIDSIAKIPEETVKQPKFVYAHFFLPHPPFFYNERGESNNLDLVLKDSSYFSKDLFLPYLKYTNRVMLKVVDSIFNKSTRPPVIIIQSDHGSTDYEGCPDIPYLTVKNFAAFYFPDNNYTGLYDTLSNINTFPVLFNKYFKTAIPLQGDTATYLRY